MHVTLSRARYIPAVALSLLGLLTACGGTAAPTRIETNVSGTWDATFSGTVQGRGTPQRDTLVMELRQDGTNVTGTLRFQGLDLPFPLSGTVSGTSFTFTSKASFSPTCEATVVATTTVDAAGRLSGTQTQANCEGTAIGQVTAVRR